MGRVSVFTGNGRYVRSLALPAPNPFWVRVVDDSLFLVIHALPGDTRGNLLALLRPDGSVVSRFFNQSRYLGTDPELLQSVMLIADAAHGAVFAAFTGADSVWAYDYHGRLLGSGPIDPVRPLVTSKELIARNHGRARRADGTEARAGNRDVIGIVALDSGSVALQVAPYDAEHGTDPLDGGTLLVSALGVGGRIRPVGRAEVVGGLLGRDRAAAPLLLRYAGADVDRYELLRVRLRPRSATVVRQ